jgi:hypothetical protein
VKTQSLVTRILMIVEFQGALHEDVVQDRLDCFREAVLPGEYGVLLYRPVVGDLPAFGIAADQAAAVNLGPVVGPEDPDE